MQPYTFVVKFRVIGTLKLRRETNVNYSESTSELFV